MKWSPNSWQQKTYQQGVAYPDAKHLQKVIDELSILPPLVTPLEIHSLKKQLALASIGKAFLLQGGDCAESFSQCTQQTITNKLKIILQMSLVLVYGLRKPIIRVGRIAGQYAKPRSQDTETINNITLPSYRGDLINRQEFTLQSRTPDPQLLLQGYHYAAITLNYIRSLVHGGFADLQHPEYWLLDFVQHSPLADQYNQLVDNVSEAMNFLRTISAVSTEPLQHVDFFTSHEALNLYYEQALSRKSEDGLYYNLSTHFPWIGMRTADINNAHVEFLRGIENPIAVKIGPSVTPDQLHELILCLNPKNEAGRLTLIVRLGAKKVTDKLPELIAAVQKHQHKILWSCDPMHGNTETTSDGIKTRRFDDILNELKESFRIHHELGSHLGGVHFELTGENVTECIGGARGLTEADLKIAYESLVDPRLNYEQALEMAMLIAGNARNL